MNEHHDEFRDRNISKQRFQHCFDDSKSINEDASLHILYNNRKRNKC
jgi:hypothetical protein